MSKLAESLVRALEHLMEVRFSTATPTIVTVYVTDYKETPAKYLTANYQWSFVRSSKDFESQLAMQIDVMVEKLHAKRGQ